MHVVQMSSRDAELFRYLAVGRPDQELFDNGLWCQHGAKINSLLPLLQTFSETTTLYSSSPFGHLRSPNDIQG